MNLYNKLASQYDEKANDRIDANMTKVGGIIPFLPKKSLHNALEIGFGAGAMLKALSEKGFDIEGIDLSSEMLAVAQKRNPNAHLYIGDFLQHSFYGKKFDLVMLQALIHLFPKHHVTAQILPKLHELLSRDGIVHMTTTQANDDTEGMFTKDDYTGESLERYRSHYTQDTFEKLFSVKNGFELLDVQIESDPISDKQWMGVTGRKIE